MKSYQIALSTKVAQKICNVEMMISSERQDKIKNEEIKPVNADKDVSQKHTVYLLQQLSQWLQVVVVGDMGKIF